MDRHAIFVSGRAYSRLRALASRLGVAVNGLVEILAETAVIEDTDNPSRVVVLIGRGTRHGGKAVVDILPWREYSRLAARLAECRAEAARLALEAAYKIDRTKAIDAILTSLKLGVDEAGLTALWADACISLADALADHGLYRLSYKALMGDKGALKTLKTYLRGEYAYLLLGACYPVIVKLYSEYSAKDRDTPRFLKIELRG